MKGFYLLYTIFTPVSRFSTYKVASCCAVMQCERNIPHWTTTVGNSLKQTPTVTLIHNIVHNNSGIYQLVAATAAYWFHHCCCMKEAGFYKALRVSKHTTDFRGRLSSSRVQFFQLMSTHITMISVSSLSTSAAELDFTWVKSDTIQPKFVFFKQIHFHFLRRVSWLV